MMENAMPYWRIYFHIVWTTKNRIPFITPEVEPFVHRAISSKLETEGGYIYAINGMEDHIHVIASIPPSKCVSDMIKAMKGSTSHLMNHDQHKPLYWQPGYGIFSVGPKGLPLVMDYVKRQKQHHGNNTLIKSLEYATERDEGPNAD
jgi:putative transposase